MTVADPLKDQADALDAKPQSRERSLVFLDGIRAMAALYVVLLHTFTLADWDLRYHWSQAPHAYYSFTGFLNVFFFGTGQSRMAVNVFIVLSGYCLMLPVIKAGTLKGGFKAFMERRAIRILPPYYAACILGLLVIGLVPGMGSDDGRIWRNALPAFTAGNLISHLFLVHNITPYAEKIISPLWSVATEWQIYVFFPLLLLPVWRMKGKLALFLVSAVIGSAAALLLPGSLGVGRCWYLCLFAIGMIGAVFSSAQYAGDPLQSRVPWGKLFCFGFLMLCLKNLLLLHRFARFPVVVWIQSNSLPALILNDLVFGGITMCFIAALALGSHIENARIPIAHTAIHGFLSSRLMRFLAKFSYSLYLIHEIFLALTDMSVDRMAMPSRAAFWYLIIVGLIVSFLFSYLFYLVFERPFINLNKTRRASLEVGGALKTA